MEDLNFERHMFKILTFSFHVKTSKFFKRFLYFTVEKKIRKRARSNVQAPSAQYHPVLSSIITYTYLY